MKKTHWFVVYLLLKKSDSAEIGCCSKLILLDNRATSKVGASDTSELK